MTTPFNVSMLRHRLDSVRVTAQRDLLAEIVNLEHRLRSARQAIESGAHVDEHLIANAAMMTSTIARWNLVRDLLPFVEDKEQP